MAAGKWESWTRLLPGRSGEDAPQHLTKDRPATACSHWHDGTLPALSVAGLECLRQRTMLTARRVHRLQVQVWTVTEDSQQLESRLEKSPAAFGGAETFWAYQVPRLPIRLGFGPAAFGEPAEVAPTSLSKGSSRDRLSSCRRHNSSPPLCALLPGQ